MNNPYDVLLAPVITENTMDLSYDRKYSFRVDPRANKHMIKDAVEKVFDVTVEKVNVINVKPKPKRQGRSFGYTSKWKKAIVTLSQDSKEIDFFSDI